MGPHRPGAGRLAEELGVLVSVDTYKAEVARRALKAGVAIINDIWGFAFDPDMPAVVATAMPPPC